jgi:hypothetical protein
MVIQACKKAPSERNVKSSVATKISKRKSTFRSDGAFSRLLILSTNITSLWDFV